MKKWFLFLAIIILATLQLVWPSFLNFFRCKPDFLLIFAIVLVFYLDFKTALIFSILAGLTKDLFLPNSFAINTLFFTLWSYFVYRLCRQISTDNNYVRLAIVLGVSLLNNIIIGLFVINAGNIIAFGIFLRTILISSIYTTIFAPLVFKLIENKLKT